MRTQIVRGSELVEKVISQIHATRFSEEVEPERRKLARYEKARGDREEKTGTIPGDWFGREVTGFFAKAPLKDLDWAKVTRRSSCSDRA